MPAPQRIDRRVRLTLMLAAFALAAIAAFVGSRALTDSDSSQSTSRPGLQAILGSLVSRPGRIAPGATAYVRGPKGIWIGSAGVADIEHGTLMPVDARMRLESVSKIRTARLEQSAYDPQGPIAGPHALGYALSENRHAEDATDSHGGVAAEGGVVADAEDTATFLDALMHGKLLGPSMLAAMKRDVFWSGGEPTGCGGVAYGHSGGGSGFKTNVWVSGDGSRVAVLLLNGRSGDDGDVRAGAAMHELYCKG